jgi:trans-aconitate 2-methyltransferase
MGSNITKKDIEDYYDSFREHQQQLGINIRHRTIYRNLLKAGLSENSNVLEIGCGIGTVSSLILKTVIKGKFVGADISAGSIQMAKSLSEKHANAEFVVTDMRNFASKVKFDYILLPDVLEHIPVEQHHDLFLTVYSVANEAATVLINIPEPHTQDWNRTHRPEKMQIIDQSLDFRKLVDDACSAGFELSSLNPYCLHSTEPDYVSIIFRKPSERSDYVLKNWWRRGFENLFGRIM